MLLQNEIQNYVATILPDLGSDYRITARIYLDLKHTSERCQQARIINSKTVLEDFLRGFNSSQGLFDVVDTTRKTVAAQKLIGQCLREMADDVG